MTRAYAIEYRRRAARYLTLLPRGERDRIFDAIESLAKDPDTERLDTKKLNNRPGYRLRVGRYRVLYERRDDRLVILVVAIGPRGDAYKR
jgi:mRNA interferase RelE/StbE